MSNYRGRGGGYGQPQRRSYPSHARDDFYDDRRSRSRSPDRRRRSPPYDISRSRQSPDGNTDGRSPGRWRDRSRGSSSPQHSRGYHDRDKPYDDDRGRRPISSGSGTPEPQRHSSRGRPSKEIMMEGLAPHLTENDVSAELREHYHVENLDDVRIIRDRQTKQSRQFGFLRFAAVEDAETFMDRNYPVLYLYGDSNKASNDPDECKVKISYGRERKENKSEEGDWNCSACHINNFATRTRCFRCQAPRTDWGPSGGTSKAANIGDNDASPENIPSQFLLFRGLEPSVTEEHFAKGASKLNKPTGSTAQPTVTTSGKKSKVASTTGDANLGARDGTLRRILLVRDRRSNDSWRYGFAEYASIEDAQAALNRFHSFDRFTIASKQVLVSYIHAGVFVPQPSPTPSIERFLFSPVGNSSVKLQYWDEDAYVTELPISMPDPSDLVKTVSATAEPEGFKSTKDIDKTKKRKAIPDSTTPGTKKQPSQLQFWSNRHAELHGIERKKGSQANSDAGDDAAPPSQSFADPERHCCYLCMRQFTSTAEVNKHERLSSLHRQNLKDSAKVEKAKHKLEKHSANPGTSQSEAPALEYRDRAKERRKIYGVVNKKGEQVGKAPRPNLDNGNDEIATPLQSKGASLLSKMGYTAGQGLGATGEGMTEALKQDVYVAGVGLGAQGGRLGDAQEEAERNTKGDYQSWIEKGREGARQRYRNMGE